MVTMVWKMAAKNHCNILLKQFSNFATTVHNIKNIILNYPQNLYSMWLNGIAIAHGILLEHCAAWHAIYIVC